MHKVSLKNAKAANSDIIEGHFWQSLSIVWFGEIRKSIRCFCSGVIVVSTHHWVIHIDVLINELKLATRSLCCRSSNCSWCRCRQRSRWRWCSNLHLDRHDTLSSFCLDSHERRSARYWGWRLFLHLDTRSSWYQWCSDAMSLKVLLSTHLLDEFLYLVLVVVE